MSPPRRVVVDEDSNRGRRDGFDMTGGGVLGNQAIDGGGVLGVQLGSMRELDAMSLALAEICDGEPVEILKALASRESLLKEIGERRGEVEQVRGDRAVRDEILALAAAVHERDQKTLGTILARRDEILAELKSVDRSREAIRAYGPGERDRRRYRDDSA